MGTIVNSAASITKDIGIDALHLNLNLNLNLNFSPNLKHKLFILPIVGGTTIITLSCGIEAVLQPLKVKEEDG